MTKESQNHFQAVRKRRASREFVAQIRDMFPGGTCSDTLGIAAPYSLTTEGRAMKYRRGGEASAGTGEADSSERRKDMY
jgi:hypothetical protein